MTCTFTDFGQSRVVEGVHHRQQYGPAKAILNWHETEKMKKTDKERETRGRTLALFTIFYIWWFYTHWYTIPRNLGILPKNWKKATNLLHASFHGISFQVKTLILKQILFSLKLKDLANAWPTQNIANFELVVFQRLWKKL